MQLGSNTYRVARCFTTNDKDTAEIVISAFAAYAGVCDGVTIEQSRVLLLRAVLDAVSDRRHGAAPDAPRFIRLHGRPVEVTSKLYTYLVLRMLGDCTLTQIAEITDANELHVARQLRDGLHALRDPD